MSRLNNLSTDLINKIVNGDIIINIDSTSAKVSDETKDYNYKLSIRRSNSIAKYIIDKLIKDNIDNINNPDLLDYKTPLDLAILAAIRNREIEPEKKWKVVLLLLFVSIFLLLYV